MNCTNVLVVGTGEYTTGFVPGAEAAPDKKAGVIGTTLFDLRRRGFVDRILLAGTNGTKFPAIREHFQRSISDAYRDMYSVFENFPAEHVASDPNAYRMALRSLQPGDAVIVFTPDDTHFQIAMDAMEHGCHVLIAKPMVKSTKEHLQLSEIAENKNLLVAMEVHKRWDPIYVDARDRIRNLGDFSFFQSYMSQPKSQLDTFRAWAGKSSDISYYLNSHHIDFHVWACSHFAKPICVRGLASTGVAHALGIQTEDTITLTVDWENLVSKNRGVAIYTASWIAPKSDVHSQQRFFYMGHMGEIQVDQAHRGYSISTDSSGFASPNPLFMKFTADAEGYFSGQNGYGYRSIESFLQAVRQMRSGQMNARAFDHQLATVHATRNVTAILEAGRRSLDRNGIAVPIDS